LAAAGARIAMMMYPLMRHGNVTTPHVAIAIRRLPAEKNFRKMISKRTASAR